MWKGKKIDNGLGKNEWWYWQLGKGGRRVVHKEAGKKGEMESRRCRRRGACGGGGKGQGVEKNDCYWRRRW